MNLLELIQRVRSMTRDFSNSIFREQDIIAYINESINRIRQIIPELSGIPTLTEKTQGVTILPEQYHHLLSIYSASRCFSQDERHYQASTLMNEFEVKIEEMRDNIQAGDVIVLDENGEDVTTPSENATSRVRDTYFGGRSMMDYDPWEEDDF